MKKIGCGAYGIIAATSLGCSNFAVLAADWVVTPLLTVGESYLDNVNLAPPGAENDDFVTSLNPGLRIKGQGERLNLSLDYRMQNLFYAKDSDRNETFHQLESSATAEFWKEKLFLDARGIFSQQIIDRREPIPLSNLNISSNRTDVAAGSISPYFKQRLGDFGLGELRYTHTLVDYKQNNIGDLQTNIGDSQADKVEATASSTPRSEGFGWVAAYRKEKIRFDDSPDADFERTGIDLRVPMGRRTSLLLGGGYEDNTFERAPGTDDPVGFFWSVGAGWDPSTRTSLAAGYGERFFGGTYFLRASHQTRLTTWRAEYTEDLATASQLQLEEPVFDPSGMQGQLAQVDLSFPRISSQIFLQKRFKGGVDYTAGRSTLVLDLFHVRREFEATTEEDKSYGGNASWTWRIGRRTQTVVSGQWARLDFTSNDLQDKLYGVNARLVRQLSRNSSGEAGYAYYRLDSNDPEREYRENVVDVFVNMAF